MNHQLSEAEYQKVNIATLVADREYQLREYALLRNNIRRTVCSINEEFERFMDIAGVEESKLIAHFKSDTRVIALQKELSRLKRIRNELVTNHIKPTKYELKSAQRVLEK